MSSCHGHEDTAAGPRLGRNLTWSLIALAAALAVSQLEALAAFRMSLYAYLGLIWWAVAAGLLIGGIIDYIVPRSFVTHLLGQHQRWSILYAVAAGVLMSACSHGILAIAIQLYKKGAAIPSVIAFLLASPWANLPMTILLFGFFGWYGLVFVGGAVLIALSSGYLFSMLARSNWIEQPLEVAEPEVISWAHLGAAKPREAVFGVYAGTVSLANMVLWWIIVGVLIAALIGAYVPRDFFVNYLGSDISGLLWTLLAATVLEVCSEGTAPLAFEVFDNVQALGNPLVFLLAGVATDYTEIGLLWSNIGRRTALWLPIVTVPQILLLAILLNTFVSF